MTDTNQKLREALQAISDIDDSTNHAVDASAALDRIGQIARQALALPTAPPVGERELPQLPMHYAMMNLPHCPHVNGYTADQMRAYARAALSAGDAVDAQRWRYAMDWGTKDFAVCMRVGATGVCWEPIKTDGLIDAAMRKGQL